jgi:hypothetical protein
MGLGDNLMATGFAKGAAKHGKRIAFGNGETILWDQYSEQIFQYNPNIARPGDEGASDLEWIPFYKGNRLYNKHDLAKERWIWNYDFKAVPGEMFFTEKELKFAKGFGNGFVLIEPHVPTYKGCAPNKTWSLNRYRNVVQMLKIKGHDVRQFSHAGDALPGVGAIHAPTFRHALTPCKHCEEAMLAIKSKHVYDAAKVFLECSTSPHGSGEQSGQHTTLNGYSVGSNVI